MLRTKKVSPSSSAPTRPLILTGGPRIGWAFFVVRRQVIRPRTSTCVKVKEFIGAPVDAIVGVTALIHQAVPFEKVASFFHRIESRGPAAEILRRDDVLKHQSGFRCGHRHGVQADGHAFRQVLDGKAVMTK